MRNTYPKPPNELSKSGMCQCDPLAHKTPKTHVVVQVEMVPFVLPVVGLVLVVAQIVYGEVPQNP